MSTLPGSSDVTLSTMLSNNRSTATSLCIENQRMIHLIQVIVLTILLPIHLFLCVSVIIYRHKLRSNIVNMYAVNVLAGNLVSCLVRAVNVYYMYFGETIKTDEDLHDHAYILYIWLFLKSIELSMFLVISGGIGLLIMALRENLFRVHRTVAGMSRNSLPNILPPDKMKSNTSSISKPMCYSLKKFIKRHPRRWAYLLICISWILPVAIIAFILSDRGCIESCRCPLSQAHWVPSLSGCPVEKGCSIIWAPAKSRAIIICFCVWIVYVVILIGLLVQSFINFRQIIAERRYVMKMQMNNSLDDGIGGYSSRGHIESSPGNDLGQEGEESSSNSNKFPNSKYEIQPEKPSTFSRRGRSKHMMSNSLLLESLKNNLCFILTISIVFISGTGVVAIFALMVSIDPNITFYNKDELVLLPFFLIPPLTETLNSVLLGITLLGIRSAAKSLTRAILQCRCIKKK